ncbi:leukocyte immunoglobulin-like receptor subfamily A member 3 [Hoplias malabaricus]|uniref:leukocyte immunoglobulin-like receptor subfamily A member 3 n=1 Tax=Hoplias malabaricus TaxID=27720 RepID=UPI00346287A2
MTFHFVTVRPRPTVKVQPAAGVFIKERVTLTCEINSGVNGKYVWYKNNSEVQNSQQKEYEIDSVDGSRAGVYTCEGARSSGQIYTETSNSVRLSVSDRPTPTVKVQPAQSVFIGERVTLTCDTQSGVYQNYEWYKSNGPHPSSQRKKYVISSVAQTHKGDYTCKGKGSSDRIYTHTSTPLTLTVSERPKPTVKVLPTQSVFIGESVTLTCEIQSTYPWSYEWKKAGVQLRGSQRLNPYLISRVDRSHAGGYTCKGTHSDRIYTHTSDSVWLSVSVKPKPTLTSSRNGSVLRGNPVALSCTLGQSAGWTFYWFRDTESPEINTRSSIYTISSVSDSNGGQYRCRAGRGHPVYYTHYSDALWVNVTDGDVILESPVHSVSEGDSLTLRCLIRSTNSSHLQVDFYKDGVLLQNQTTGEMTIHKVSKANEGLYHCKHPEKGESPRSWISVRESPFSVLRVLSSLMAVAPYLITSVVLGVKCYRARVKPYAVIEAGASD